MENTPDNQYPPTQPSNEAYPLPYSQYPAANAYPPSAPQQYQPAPAPYPATYPAQPQPPGTVQQQQQLNTVVVAAVQPATAVVQSVVKPPNYFALSLVNLICCCLPLGIAALIYSLRVDSEFAAGRYEEAKRASDIARNINYVGFGIGISLIVIYTIVIIASAAASAASG